MGRSKVTREGSLTDHCGPRGSGAQKATSSIVTSSSLPQDARPSFTIKVPGVTYPLVVKTNTRSEKKQPGKSVLVLGRNAGSTALKSIQSIVSCRLIMHALLTAVPVRSPTHRASGPG